MQFVYDDGGRSAAGYRGHTGDCGVRAVAIALRVPYSSIVSDVERMSESERPGEGRRRKSSVRAGIRKKSFRQYMASKGWEWVPCMGIGTGCRVHARAEELPGGRVIVALSRHYAAVIDGVLHDTYDSSRSGTRCVYGYWIEGSSAS